MMDELQNKSLMQVLYNIAWLIFDKIFLLGMNLVVLFIVANFYGPSKYGLFQYAANIVMILEIIVQLIDGRIVKKLYVNKNFDHIVFNVTVAKVLLSCIALFIGCMVIVFDQRELEFSVILVLLLFDSIIKNFRFGMENRFEFNLQSRKVVIASNIGLFLGTLLQLFAVLIKLPIRYIAVIQVISTSIGLLVLYYQYISEYKIKRGQHLDYSLIISIFKESFPLAIAAAACVIYTRCDAVMLGMMLTTTEVGIYSISSKLVSTVQILILPIQTTVFVKMLEWLKDKDKYEKNYLKITSIATWISISGILFSLMALPFIFKLLKPEYLPALDVYKVLSIGAIFAYNAILRSSHFTLMNCGRILMVTQIFTVVINVAANYVLIKSYGMIGAALATVLSQFLSLLISNAFFQDAKFVLKNQIKAFNPSYMFIH